MKRIILLSLMLSGLAQAGPLADAQQKLEDMEFEEALGLAEQVLQSPGSQPSDLVDAYRIKGLCLSSADKAEEARTAFQRALSIDPGMEISADTSPKLSAPFYQAKAIVREIDPIRLRHEDQGPRVGEADRLLEVNLASDPMQLVRGIHLCQKNGDGDWHCGSTTEVKGPGKFSLKLAPAAAEATVVYFFEALNVHGGVLFRAGSRDKPFGQAPAPVAVAVVEEPKKGADEPWTDETDTKQPAGLWYEQWWFWTAVGVVVAGTAVGLGVGLSSPAGGAIDYKVSVE